MAKRHRLIKKALKSLGWDWQDKENPLNTIKDVDHIIWQCNDGLSQVESARADLDECEETLKSSLEDMKTLKDQIEIEEYKELNPNRNILKI
ncbi:hypothetical protein [Flagellimonas sp. SN16]|uniref:hypothetical protein n=1 Tax=Flagellimonas sp. SN16 TaxID=3415142 RepID=UPI003C51E737